MGIKTIVLLERAFHVLMHVQITFLHFASGLNIAPKFMIRTFDGREMH